MGVQHPIIGKHVRNVSLISPVLDKASGCSDMASCLKQLLVLLQVLSTNGFLSPLDLSHVSGPGPGGGMDVTNEDPGQWGAVLDLTGTEH